jgi:acyl dehydratase
MAITVMPLERLKQCIGEEKTTEWIEITQDRIDRFADCTEDRNFIHVDPARAKNGPFGCTVAHGFLILSLLSHLSASGIWIPEGITSAVNYGFDRVRFVKPVPSGSRIRSIMKLAGVDEKEGGKILVAVSHAVFAEGSEKPALIAEWISLFM